jgi:hypothetical protein
MNPRKSGFRSSHHSARLHNDYENPLLPAFDGPATAARFCATAGLRCSRSFFAKLTIGPGSTVKITGSKREIVEGENHEPGSRHEFNFHG